LANHIRAQIRHAIVEILTGLPTTGANVFQSKVSALQDDELPALKVSTNKEVIDAITINSDPTLERELVAVVTVVVKAVDGLDDEIDQIIKEVEQAINQSEEVNTLGGLVKSMVLTDIDIDGNSEAETPTGEAVLSLKIEYYTQASVPDVSI
jgi:hypothetical protein